VSENVLGHEWDVEQDQPGFRWKRLRLGRRLGGELLGASVYEMPPGERSFPYHFHHGNEELLVVVEGSVAVRTPEGEQKLGKGAAALFNGDPRERTRSSTGQRGRLGSCWSRR
jgi:uncharacterized cupin superfamily protein